MVGKQKYVIPLDVEEDEEDIQYEEEAFKDEAADDNQNYSSDDNNNYAEDAEEEIADDDDGEELVPGISQSEERNINKQNSYQQNSNQDTKANQNRPLATSNSGN